METLVVRSSVKSAEVSLNSVITDSNIGTKEVRAHLCEAIMKGMVNDMSGVYKIPMERMLWHLHNWRTSEFKQLYEAYGETHRDANASLVWSGKNICYEKPYKTKTS